MLEKGQKLSETLINAFQGVSKKRFLQKHQVVKPFLVFFARACHLLFSHPTFLQIEKHILNAFYSAANKSSTRLQLCGCSTADLPVLRRCEDPLTYLINSLFLSPEAGYHYSSIYRVSVVLREDAHTH